MPQYDMFRAYELCLSPSASPGAIGEALVGDPLGSAARAAVGATHGAAQGGAASAAQDIASGCRRALAALGSTKKPRYVEQSKCGGPTYRRETLTHAVA